MDKIPFTSFDFWGYLACGFLLLCGIDHAAGLGLIAKKEWPVGEGLFVATAAYVLGHVNATISALVFDSVVKYGLGRVHLGLMQESTKPRWVTAVFAFYFEPLPKETREQILEKAKAVKVTAAGEALFWLAFNKGKSCEKTMVRVGNFLNQYSFCRNVSTACVLAAVAMWLLPRFGLGAPVNGWWVGGAAAVGFVMFLRYLKFLRHYSIEVLTHYAGTT